MYHIYRLLNELRSTDKDTRLMACKKLRRVSKLTDEAISALGLASIDTDPYVAREARFTLLAYRLKRIFSHLLHGLLIIAVIAFIGWLVGDIGKTARLTCERIDQGAPVVCVEQPYYYFLIPRHEREIRDVRAADIIVITDDEGDELYNLKLVTGDGEVELNSGFTYDYPSKRNLRDKINDFVDSDSESRLVLSDPGGLTFWNAFIIVGLPLAVILAYALLSSLSKLWKRSKPGKQRNINSKESPRLAEVIQPAPDDRRSYFQSKWGMPSERATSSTSPNHPTANASDDNMLNQNGN